MRIFTIAAALALALTLALVPATGAGCGSGPKSLEREWKEKTAKDCHALAELVEELHQDLSRVHRGFESELKKTGPKRALYNAGLFSRLGRLAKKGKKWRSLGQVWRIFGQLWCRLGAVWRHSGQVWQQKTPKNRV